MEEIILKATPRTENPKRARRAGFIPGVLHEHDTTSTSIQFEATALNKVITKHGQNAKVWVDLGTEKKFGFIKEVQNNPVDGKVIHISIQVVSQDQDVKMQLPISFHGREALEQKMLQLQVHKAEIEVIGRPAVMPDVVVVNVDKKALGDTITAADFHLSQDIKILDPENEIYAAVKAVREEAAAEPEKETPAQA